MDASSKVKVGSRFHRWASFTSQKCCDSGFDRYAFSWSDDRLSEQLGCMVGLCKGRRNKPDSGEILLSHE